MSRIYVLFVLLLVEIARADYYVRDGGTGSGTSWSDAADQVPSSSSYTRSVGTIWLADGSYSGFTLDEANSGSTVISIKKATASSHGTETGWQSTYGDGVATISGNIIIHTDYWTIDGVTGGGPGSWTSGFGIKINGQILAIGPGFDVGLSSGDNTTIQHVEIEGTLTPSTDDAISLNRSDNVTISYVYTHNTDNCPLNFFICTGVTVEYSYFGQFTSSVEHHAEILFLYGTSNVALRWNLFRWAESTGGLMCHTGSSTTGVFVYGNVFYRASGETWSYGGDGLVGVWSNRADLECNNLKIFNNTFINIPSDAAGIIGTTPHSGLEWKNNYFYSSDTGLPNGNWSHDYNHYQDSGSESESNGTTGSGDPFVNYAALDFALDANTTAGTDLGSPYNVDMLGNTRTTWTRGAIEFQSGSGGSATIQTLNVQNLNITGP